MKTVPSKTFSLLRSPDPTPFVDGQALAEHCYARLFKYRISALPKHSDEYRTILQVVAPSSVQCEGGLYALAAAQMIYL
jgi:hypothetical protein